MSTAEKKPVSMVYALLLGLVSLSLGWFGLAAGQKESFEKAVRLEGDLMRRFEASHRKELNLPALRQQMVEIAQDIEAVTSLLPNELDQPAMRSDWSERAAAHGVKLVNVEFGREELSDFHAEVPFRMVAKGTYSALHDYLYDEFYARRGALRLGDFYLVRDVSGKQLVLTISGKQYRYLEEQG